MPSHLVFRHSLLRQTWSPNISVVAAGVHDPALIAVIGHAVKALLAAEKGPGHSSSNLRGNSVSVKSQVPAPPPSLLQQTVTFFNSGGAFLEQQALSSPSTTQGRPNFTVPSFFPLLQPRNR